MPPSTMKALVIGRRSWLTILWRGITKRDVSHGASVREDISTPTLAPDEILIKVKTVALNPTDWKHIAYLSPPQAIIGCDYVGEIAGMGNAVPAGAWKIGDRVAGTVHGGLYKDQGAFAEYCKIPYDLAWTPPATISNHEATTYGVSALTAMMALYHNLGVPWPDTEDKSDASIFIYGGSTTAGLYASRMAKHAGLRVVTTCSPHSFELVKRYGADAAFDYRSKTCVQDIIKEFPDVNIAMDCISEGGSKEITRKVVAANGKGGKIIQLLGNTNGKTKDGIEERGILAYSLLGREWQWLAPLGPKWPAVPADRKAAERFVKIAPSLLDWLVPIPTELVEGGWDGLEKGLEMLKGGKVSGRKLVVDLA